MTFNNFILGWIGLAVVTFIYLFFKPAPYGRHAQKGWGKEINAKLAWILMETPVLIIVLIYYFSNYQSMQWPGTLFIAFFCLHYVNRCFIYPFRLSAGANKVPLTIILSANIFNLVNGNVIGYYFTQAADFSTFEVSFPFYLGIALFFIGMIINLRADNKLSAVKKSATGYVIPYGGLYKYISSPNYFGELIEWFGFALAVGHLAAWSFFIWCVANLAPRAFAHHKWYKQKFTDYPSDRKALIPFVW